MEYYIKTKNKTWFPFDGWLTRLEMRAFGWTYEGSKTEYLNSYSISYDESRDKVTARQNSKHYQIFERISPYTFNPIFIFLEFLMSIFSWIRRKLIYLLFVLAIFGLVLGLVQNNQELIKGGIGILAFIYGPSIVLLVLGFLMRIIFRMDSRLKRKVRKSYEEDDEEDKQYGNYSNNRYGNNNGYNGNGYANPYNNGYGNYGNSYGNPYNNYGNYGNGYGNPYNGYGNYGNNYGNYGGQYQNYGNQNGNYGSRNDNYGRENNKNRKR